MLKEDFSLKEEICETDDFCVDPEENEINREIKALSEEARKTKILIRLGERGLGKFIVMEDEDENSYIVSLPLENYLYSTHGSIGLYIESIIKKKFKIKGVGIIKVKRDKLILGGSSSQYGEADTNYVKNEIEKSFPGIKVEIEIKQ